VNRFRQALGTAIIGALLAAAYVVGAFRATGRSSQGAEPGLLRLDAYCHHLYGERADAYRPQDLNGWRCSVWRNGVWGLEEVDLLAACHWQSGPQARLVTPESSGDATDLRLLCTS
jgi:hypothetical protein